MSDHAQHPRIILIAGLAGCMIMVLFVVSNFVLGDFQPPAPSAGGEEIAGFVAGHQVPLQWAVGMRYVVFLLFPVFGFGVYRHVRGTDEFSRGLAIVGLMGVAWLLAVGTVANTFESLLLFERNRLVSAPDLARMLSLGMNGLFDVAMLPHALIIVCFSEAGRRTGTLPWWVCTLGYLQAATGVVGSVALARSLEMSMFFYLTTGLSFFAFAVWYTITSVVLVRAGAKARRPG